MYLPLTQCTSLSREKELFTRASHARQSRAQCRENLLKTVSPPKGGRRQAPHASPLISLCGGGKWEGALISLRADPPRGFTRC